MRRSVAEYRIKVSTETEDAKRKLNEVDRVATRVERRREIKFDIPSIDETKRALNDLGQAANVAFQVFKLVHPIGQSIAELQEPLQRAVEVTSNLGRTLERVGVYASPVRALKDTFGTVNKSIQVVTETTAQLGFAIMGITQSVNLVKEAFGQMFDDTVGREVRLREQILQTSITLASTNRVLLKGVEIEDPTAKLKALEKPIEASIERLRTKSLEIAGTTSEALISTFSIVSSQIGRFGGTLKDAEDLAAKFSGALGTLGMSDPAYARQEIGSILMGNIGPDSILAKTLGITNPDIDQAKKSAGGLIEFLKKKLETFEAGQKQASLGFTGVTSNFKELGQEIKRNFGAPILDGILTRLNKFYDLITGQGNKEVFKKYLKAARSFGSLVANIGSDALGEAASSVVGKSINTKTFTDFAETLERTFARVSLYITEQFTKAGPAIRSFINAIAAAVKTLLPTFVELVATLAKLKVDQLQIQLTSFSQLVRVIASLAEAYKYYLEMLNQFMSTPLGQYINQIRAEFKVLESAGVMSVARLVASLVLARASFAAFKEGLIAVATAIKVGLVNAINTLGAVFEFVAKIVVTTITTVVNVVTTAVSNLARLGVTVFTELQTVLAAVSTQFAAMGGVFQTLSQPLMKMSVALGVLNTALDKTDANMIDFAAKTRAAMGVADVSIQQTKANILNLGEIIGTKLVNGAKAAGGALLNLGGVFLRSIATMALWQITFAVVFDGIRRLGEAWERMNQDKQGVIAIKELNNGLAEQARQARETGKALDEVTAARLRLRTEETNTTIKNNQKDIENSILKEQDLLEKKAILQKDLNRKEYKLYSNSEAVKEIKLIDEQLKKLKTERVKSEEAIKRAKAALAALEPKASGQADDPSLAPTRDRQQIQDLANFEKSTRLAIEDEIYNYRRQVQQRELELFRTKGEVEIAQIDYRNRRLIEGTKSDAQASLQALNTYITTKKRAELDLETKKREAATALGELERAIGRFRSNLEQQIADLRTRITDYEIKVLDQRIKGERLIAQIREGVITWEAAGGNGGAGEGGAAFVGQTGRATGPHAHLQGTDKAKVVEEAINAIKSWQGQGVKYIQLSNAKIEVAGLKDDKQLRAAIATEIAAHSPRSRRGVYTADIAVPEGTPVPVALGPIGWDKGGGGNVGTNPRTGIAWMHLKNGSRGGSTGAPTGVTNSGLTEFERGYLTRLSNLEGGYGVNGSAAKNPRSNARGYFQLLPSTERYLRQSGKGTLADRLLSTDYNVAIKAAKEFALWSRPAGRDLFAEGDVAGLDRLYNRTWTSLPGGKEAATGNRLARGNAFLKPGATTGATPGSIPEGGVTPPPKPDVTLNLDTGELDTALSKLKAISAELLKQQATLANIQTKEAWDQYIKTLDVTTKPLEAALIQKHNEQLRAETIIGTLKDNPYADPEQMQAEIQYKQTLADLDAKRIEDQKAISSLEGLTDEDRKKALKAEEEAYISNKARLDQIRTTEQERLNIAKQIAQYTDIQNSITNSSVSAMSEFIQMSTSAASATLSPTDFINKRILTARETIARDYNERTKGGTQPLQGEAISKYNDFVKQQFSIARSLAAVDKELYIFSERLKVAQESAQTLTEGYKGMLRSVMQGESPGKAAEQMVQNISNRFMDMALDYAFKPIEAQFESMFKKVFNVNDPQAANTGALTSLTDQIKQSLVPSIDNLTSALTTSKDGKAGSPQSPQKKIEQEGDNLVTSLQRVVSGITTVATTALAITGGIQQMKKGGIYNTLIGLASIFGGLGSGLSMFGKGGIFGARASGGPIRANRPYLVGEQGPELFMSKIDGQILSNGDTQGYFAQTRAALTRRPSPERDAVATLPAPAPIDIRFESQTINSVEYVTAEQHRKGMEMAAKRGQLLAYQGLQHSVKVRRRLGI